MNDHRGESPRFFSGVLGRAFCFGTSHACFHAKSLEKDAAQTLNLKPCIPTVGEFKSLEREAVGTLLAMHGVKETEDPRSKWKKRQKGDMWIQVNPNPWSKWKKGSKCGVRIQARVQGLVFRSSNPTFGPPEQFGKEV